MNNEKQKRDHKFGTKVVRNQKIRGPVHPLAVPIYSTSTYELDSAAHGAALSSHEEVGELSPWLYSRWGNPTNDAVASALTTIEPGYGSFLTSSGMSAITTAVFTHLKSGDHAIAPNPVYGGTHEIFASVLPNYGIDVTFVDGTNPEAYNAALQDNTKLLYVESPGNPTMSIIDIKAIASLGKNNSVTTMIDSTFASPYNQNPIPIGIDVVIHSATKYLGGHHDIIAGSITSATKEIHRQTFQTLKLFGGTLSPFDAFLLGRGLKTMDVRMQRHNSNGLQVAEFLASQPNIEIVHYPGLETHPQHSIAKKQMRGFGGMIAFEVKGGLEPGRKLIENLDVILLAVSLGGVESLIEQASTMTHTMVDREERLKGGITDGLIRFSVGLEDPIDLINDLTQALDRI